MTSDIVPSFSSDRNNAAAHPNHEEGETNDFTSLSVTPNQLRAQYEQHQQRRTEEDRAAEEEREQRRFDSPLSPFDRRVHPDQIHNVQSSHASAVQVQEEDFSCRLAENDNNSPVSSITHDADDGNGDDGDDSKNTIQHDIADSPVQTSHKQASCRARGTKEGACALYDSGKEWQESRDRHVAAQRREQYTREMAHCTFAPALTRKRNTARAHVGEYELADSSDARVSAVQDSHETHSMHHERGNEEYNDSAKQQKDRLPNEASYHDARKRDTPLRQQCGQHDLTRRSHVEKVAVERERCGHAEKKQTILTVSAAPFHSDTAVSRNGTRRGTRRRDAVGAGLAATSSLSSSFASMTSCSASSSSLSSSLMLSLTSSSSEDEQKQEHIENRDNGGAQEQPRQVKQQKASHVCTMRPLPSSQLQQQRARPRSHGCRDWNSKDILFVRPGVCVSHVRQQQQQYAPITQHSEQNALRYLRALGAAPKSHPSSETKVRNLRHDVEDELVKHETLDPTDTNSSRTKNDSRSVSDVGCKNEPFHVTKNTQQSMQDTPRRCPARRSVQQFLSDVAQDMQRRADHRAQLSARYDIPRDAKDRLYESLTGRPLFRPNAMPTLELTAGQRVSYADLSEKDQQRLRDALRENHMESILRERERSRGAPQQRQKRVGVVESTLTSESALGSVAAPNAAHTGNASKDASMNSNARNMGNSDSSGEQSNNHENGNNKHDEPSDTHIHENKPNHSSSSSDSNPSRANAKNKPGRSEVTMRDTLTRMAHYEEQSRARRARSEAALADERSRLLTFHPHLSRHSMILARRRAGARHIADAIKATDASDNGAVQSREQQRQDQHEQHDNGQQQSGEQRTAKKERATKDHVRGANATRKGQMADMLTRSAAWQHRRAQQLRMARAEQSARETQECVFVPQCAALHMPQRDGWQGQASARAFSVSQKQQQFHVDACVSACALSSIAPSDSISLPRQRQHQSKQHELRQQQQQRRQLDILAASSDVRLINEVNQLHTQLAAVPKVEMWRESVRCGLAGVPIKHKRIKRDALSNDEEDSSSSHKARHARARSRGAPNDSNSASRWIAQPQELWPRSGVGSLQSSPRSLPPAAKVTHHGEYASELHVHEQKSSATPRQRVALQYGNPSAYATTPRSASSSPMSEPHYAKSAMVPMIRYLTRDEDVEEAEGHVWSALDAQTDALLRQL